MLFMERCTKECPWCRAKVSKELGCNKMTCYACHRYFCWTCMSKITSKNPYDHFKFSTACWNDDFGKDVNYNLDKKELDQANTNEFIIKATNNAVICPKCGSLQERKQKKNLVACTCNTQFCFM